MSLVLLCSAFNPPVAGTEDHNEHGIYPAVTDSGEQLYHIPKSKLPELIKAPTALANGTEPYPPAQASPKTPANLGEISFAPVTKADGKDMFSLADRTTLDKNSPYAYMTMANHFGGESVGALVRVCMGYPCVACGLLPAVLTTCMCVLCLCAAWGNDRGVGGGAPTVARAENGDMVGFVMAYRPPQARNTIFVWQIGVAPEAAGQGLGGRLLDALADQAVKASADEPEASRVRYMEATVTPNNAASRNLFKAFGRRRGADVEITSDFYSVNDFPAASADGSELNHEPEDKFVIGPF